MKNGLMKYERVDYMTRKELESKYEALGLTDYKLRTLEQLNAIHGVNVQTLSGYDTLSDEHRELFDKTIINFFNGRGLDARKALIPKSINYVLQVDYIKYLPDEDCYETVKTEIFLLKDNEIKKRLHRYVFEKGVNFKECKRNEKSYLRFELKDEWYHLLSTTNWY